VSKVDGRNGMRGTSPSRSGKGLTVASVVGKLDEGKAGHTLHLDFCGRGRRDRQPFFDDDVHQDEARILRIDGDAIDLAGADTAKAHLRL
jgi:hypothetical protein